ncbi:MAG TPA: TolC family protein [Chthoniobacteraceae bacterium]|jgi:outer membrane protein TolC|nr:TolC family protein [Chthoniobacteraceae bacterium]
MLLIRTLSTAALVFLISAPAPEAEEMWAARPIIHKFSGDLSLDEAVKTALRQNPDVLKQLEEIQRTRGQYIEVRAEALPHLTLTATYDQRAKELFDTGSRSSGLQFRTNDPTLGQVVGELGGGDSSNFIQNKSWQVIFEMRQALYRGGQVRAAINIGQFARDSAYFQLRDIIDQMVANVRTQFTNVLTNRALIGVAEETVKLQEDQLRDQKNRFEAGTVPRFNVLRAEVELANVQPDLIRARNRYLLSEIALAKTLGLDPGPGGKPTFNVVGTLTVIGRPLGLQAALDLGRARRPFLKVQRLQILQRAEEVKVALAGYKPRLDANVGYEFRNSRLSERLDDVIDGWFLGFTGSWDIFDGFATYGRVTQARAQLESAKINYDDSVQRVDLEVQTAYANLQTARETIRSQQKNVEQALESLRLANERFAAGAGTQLEVLDARVALTRARSTELLARGDYNTALAEFDRATATDTLYVEYLRDPLARLERKVLGKALEVEGTKDAKEKPSPPKKK